MSRTFTERLSLREIEKALKEEKEIQQEISKKEMPEYRSKTPAKKKTK